MIVDLHNHTTLCNHAEGSMEAYVKQAIHNKTRYFGFSEHAYMPFDEGYRIPKEKMPWYEAEISRLKQKYENDITVLTGYEVDYLPGKMDPDVLERPVDYFIGSVHFLDDWSFDNPEFIGEYDHRDIDTVWREYFDAITAMAESGLFDIVGHLDLIKVFKFLPEGSMQTHYARALDAIKAAGMSIEINPAGWRKKIGEAYPSDALLAMAAQREIPVTFGSDAHRPEDVGWRSDDLLALARHHGYRECALYRNRNREMIKF